MAASTPKDAQDAVRIFLAELERRGNRTVRKRGLGRRIKNDFRFHFVQKPIALDRQTLNPLKRYIKTRLVNGALQDAATVEFFAPGAFVTVIHHAGSPVPESYLEPQKPMPVLLDPVPTGLPSDPDEYFKALLHAAGIHYSVIRPEPRLSLDAMRGGEGLWDAERLYFTPFLKIRVKAVLPLAGRVDIRRGGRKPKRLTTGRQTRFETGTLSDLDEIVTVTAYYPSDVETFER